MKTVFTCTFLFIINLIAAQPCLPEGITFTTQISIDDFPNNYPNCTEVVGKITIDGEQIQNLHGLSSIISAGQLEISNTQITSFQGLHNLRVATIISIYNNSGLVNMQGLNSLDSISFLIRINSNANLLNLQGLESLRYMENVFNIQNNAKLENLSGLDAFVHVGGFSITDNPSLNDFSGMPLLTEITSFVHIYNNDALISFNGLENVSTINGSVEVKENELLTSFSGFDGLQSIFGEFLILNNPSLLSLHGLESIQHIEGELRILTNTSLNNILALDNLETVQEVRISSNNSLNSLGDFTNLNPSVFWDGFLVTQNASLSDCATIPFCENPALQHSFNFQENSTGCNSRDEVLAACLVGTHSPAEDAGIHLYPNPANNRLNITGLNVSQKFNVIIFDQKGIMLDEQVLSEPSLDITSLQPGMYFLSLRTENLQVFTKFIRL